MLTEKGKLTSEVDKRSPVKTLQHLIEILNRKAKPHNATLKSNDGDFIMENNSNSTSLDENNNWRERKASIKSIKTLIKGLRSNPMKNTNAEPAYPAPPSTGKEPVKPEESKLGIGAKIKSKFKKEKTPEQIKQKKLTAVFKQKQKELEAKYKRDLADLKTQEKEQSAIVLTGGTIIPELETLIETTEAPPSPPPSYSSSTSSSSTQGKKKMKKGGQGGKPGKKVAKSNWKKVATPSKKPTKGKLTPSKTGKALPKKKAPFKK